MEQFLNQIDWRQVLGIGEILAGGYVASSVLQWIVPDVIAPLVGLLIAWRASSAYVKWKRAQAEALRPVPEKVVPTFYISRAKSRASNRRM